MSIIFAIMSGLLLNPSVAQDCGENAHKDIINKTRSLVISRHEIDPPVGEMPTQVGTLECSRVQFSINADGSPDKIFVVESSGNVAVNMAVIRAVKKYSFRKELFSQIRTYMLVFYVNDNKMPAHYLDGIGDKKNKGV